MAGGSLADIPVIKAPGFLKSAAAMKPEVHDPGIYILSHEMNSCIVYCNSKENAPGVYLVGAKNFIATWIDPVTGNTLKDNIRIKGQKSTIIPKPTANDAVLWVREKP